MVSGDGEIPSLYDTQSFVTLPTKLYLCVLSHLKLYTWKVHGDITVITSTF